MESNDNHMNKELSSEEAAKIWSEAENQIIEERSHDENFIKIKVVDRIKILRVELKDILSETIKNWQFDDLKILDRKARDINNHLSNNYNICPKCSYVNQGSANYCVKCGKLLLGRDEQSVVPTQDLDDYRQRPSISSNKYADIERKANMTITERIVARGLKNRWLALLALFFSTTCFMFMLFCTLEYYGFEYAFRGDYNIRYSPIMRFSLLYLISMTFVGYIIYWIVDDYIHKYKDWYNNRIWLPDDETRSYMKCQSEEVSSNNNK